MPTVGAPGGGAVDPQVQYKITKSITKPSKMDLLTFEIHKRDIFHVSDIKCQPWVPWGWGS